MDLNITFEAFKTACLDKEFPDEIVENRIHEYRFGHKDELSEMASLLQIHRPALFERIRIDRNMGRHAGEIVLSVDELYRIFSLYAMCKAEVENGKRIDHVTVRQVITHHLYSRAKLWLAPLETLTDEQVIEICKLADSTTIGAYRFSKWSVERKKTFFKDGDVWTNDAWVTNEKTKEMFEVDLVDGSVVLYEDKTKLKNPLPIAPDYYQWYLLNSFALPIHPYGKTPIELGIAIDITKKA